MPVTDSELCVNCGAAAPAAFCPQCGQATRDRRRPFVALVGELFEHFSLDRGVPRTVGNLLFRPGRLTDLFLSGKRAPYVQPLRLYLAMSVVFFLIFAITPPDVTHVDVYVGGVLVGAAQPAPDDGSGRQLNYEIQVMSPKEDAGWLGRKLEEIFLQGKREKFEQMDPQDLVDGMFGGMQRHVKVALFVFIPLLALALKLLFVRTPSLYYDHLVFALHFQSFLFLSLSLVWVFHSVAGYLLVLLLIVPLYLLLAMRRVYRQGWRWLVPKFVALGLAYLVLLATVFGGVMLLTLRGM